MLCYRLNYRSGLPTPRVILISNTFLFANVDGLNYLIATILGQATDGQINNFRPRRE